MLPRRPYGQTGVELSIIGFGGIVVANTEPDQASRLVSESVERGVNYFDVAPAYGNAQEKLGPALEPYRKNVFLACKTEKRDRAGAEEALNNSLKLLRTDHFDLYQLHSITSVEKDVDAIFAKGGAMEVFIEAKKSGKVRFLGFSAHSEEAAFAAMDRYDFDSVLFPVNFAAWLKDGFGPGILNRAKEKGLACLALKAMARQQWQENDPKRPTYGKCWYEPLTDRDQAALALRFTLSQPITAALPPGEAPLYRMGLDLAMDFKPITKEEENQLVALAKPLQAIFEKAS